MERKVVYFEKAGKANTERTLTLAKERARELGIKTIVFASTSGVTAQKALNIFQDSDFQLVVVGISRSHFPVEVLKMLEDKGVFARFSSEVEYVYPELMRRAFYKFSEGMKVVMELGMIAAEEGLVVENEEIVAIGGTGRRGFREGGGVDTAVVMVPRRSENFNTLPEKKEKRREIKELICKPR